MIIGNWMNAIIPAYVEDPPEPGTLSAEVDLGRPYETLLITMPALGASATAVSFMGANKTAGTFRDIYITDPADGGNNQVISAVFTTAVFAWVVPIVGYQYIKVKASTAQAAARTFRVCGVRR